MHKTSRITLAALALTGCCTALAQSNVAIYGRINTSIEHQKVGDRSVTAMVNNNSRIGFIGREDLGNGLRAGFKLEGGFQSDTGAGMLNGGGFSFGRNSHVYLSGNFGKVQLGRAGGSSYDYVADYGVLDEPNHDTGTVSDALYYGVTRGTNGISYSTPNIAGLIVEAALSMHEKDPSSDMKNSVDLSAIWGRGNWNFGAGYTKRGERNQWGLRASYTYEAFEIGAYIQRADDPVSGSVCNRATGGCGTRNSGRVNTMYTTGPSQFVIGYGWAGSWSEQRDSDAKQIMLGYNYHLSKRTKVYALFTKYDNAKNAKYGYSFNGGVGYGQDARSLGVGLRHAF